jgi:hypothetical protein
MIRKIATLFALTATLTAPVAVGMNKEAKEQPQPKQTSLQQASQEQKTPQETYSEQQKEKEVRNLFFEMLMMMQ